MNYEDCLRITINDSIANVLERFEDRLVLLMEHLEDVAIEIHMDDVLMVPKFEEDEAA